MVFCASMGIRSSKRLFFALMPSSQTRNRIKREAAFLSAQDGRLTRPDNFHITLAFLGNVDHDLLPALSERALSVQCGRFEIVLDHLVKKSKSGLLWLIPRQYPENLFKLVGDLNLNLQNGGFPTESRTFKAHVTLARKYHGNTISQYPRPIRWTVESFSLVESLPDIAWSRYVVVRSWPLS